MFISVVIPLYNKGPWVGRAIRSVLEQTHPNLELIVVDDGSTDDSAAVVASFQDVRLRLVRQQNGGVSAARNAGVDQAGADWVALLDADDWWDRQFLATCLELQSKHPGVLFGSNVRLGQTGRTAFPQPGEESWTIDDFSAAAVDQIYPPIPNGSCLVQRDALRRAGGFPLGVTLGEDTDTWVRLSWEGPFVLSRRPLIYYELGLAGGAAASSPPLCSPVFPASVGTYRRERARLAPARRRALRRYARFLLAQHLGTVRARGDWTAIRALFHHHGDVGGVPLLAGFLGSELRQQWRRWRAAIGLRTRLRHLLASVCHAQL